MSKVLVTGSDGFVGSEVCTCLLKEGLLVRGALRFAVEGRRPADRGQIEQPSYESIVVGDINAATDWADALEGIDAVVHLAARVHMMEEDSSDPLAAFREVNVAGTRRLAQEAAKVGVKRFVFVSSIKVNGEATASPFRGQKTEDGDQRSPINNHSSTIIPAAFSERDTPAPEDAYGHSKWEAEQVLREIESETGMGVVVLRPPLLYGPGVKANFLKLIQIVDEGIPLPLGGIKNKRSLLGLTNFADLVVMCIMDSRAAGQTFTVCDGDDVSSAELVRRIAKALGNKPRLLPIPEGMMKLAGKLTGKSAQVQRLCSSLRIDSAHVRNSLDWQPPCSMEKELARVATWYKSL